MDRVDGMAERIDTMLAQMESIVARAEKLVALAEVALSPIGMIESAGQAIAARFAR